MSFYHRGPVGPTRGPRINSVIDSIQRKIDETQHDLKRELRRFYNDLHLSDMVVDMDLLGNMRQRAIDKFPGFIMKGKEGRKPRSPSDALALSKLAQFINRENRNMSDLDDKFRNICQEFQVKIDGLEAQISMEKNKKAIQLAQIRSRKSDLNTKIKKEKNRLDLLYFVGESFLKPFIKSQWNSGRLCSFLKKSSFSSIAEIQRLLNQRPDTSVGEVIVAVQLSGGNIGSSSDTSPGEISIKKVEFSKVCECVNRVIRMRKELYSLRLKECEVGGCIYSCPGGCQRCQMYQ